MTPQWLNLGHVSLKDKSYYVRLFYSCHELRPHPKMKQNMDRAVVGYLEKMEKGDQDSWLQGIYRMEEWRKREKKEIESTALKSNSYGIYV